MISFGRRFGLGFLLVVGFGCGTSLPSNSSTGDSGGGSNTGGQAAVRTPADSGGGSNTGGHDGGSACAASGASCAASGCCQEIFETCIPQGSDKLCLNAIPPRPDGGSCNGGASSNLPGVQLAFPDQPCSYTAAEVAAGIEIAYDEVITAAVADLSPTQATPEAARSRTTRASSSATGSRARGRATASATPASARRRRPVTTTVVGTHTRQIPWDGRNWYGPSDTGNREGAAFPPGTYTITLTATGTRRPPTRRRRGRHVLGHRLALDHHHAIALADDHALGPREGPLGPPPSMRTPASAGRREFLAPTFVRGEPLD